MMRGKKLRCAALLCGVCLSAEVAVPPRLAAAADAAPVTQASSMPQAPVPLRDVKLAAGGRLEGMVLDRQGVPRAGAGVVLTHNGQETASATTDASGRFALTGLRGGEYVLSAGDDMTRCRLWTAEAAPPNAQEIVQLYGGDLVRGQHFRARNFFTSPLFIGTAVGAGVAIPLALHESEPQS